MIKRKEEELVDKLMDTIFACAEKLEFTLRDILNKKLDKHDKRDLITDLIYFNDRILNLFNPFLKYLKRRFLRKKKGGEV